MSCHSPGVSQKQQAPLRTRRAVILQASFGPRIEPPAAITELEAVVDDLRDIVELLEKEEGVEKLTNVEFRMTNAEIHPDKGRRAD